MNPATQLRSSLVAWRTMLLLAFAGLWLYPPQAPAANLVVKDPTGSTLFTYGLSQALVIWVGDYHNPAWKKLNNIRIEAEQVEAALRRQGFQVTLVANPNAKELRQSIEDFIQRYGFKPDSRLVIYFAGHGWTRNNDLGYLVPVDAPDVATEAGDLEFAKRALSMEQIISWSKQMEAKHVLFIFDSCFSGAVFKVRSATPPPTYLQRKLSLPVRQFLTAGDANEVVPAHSVFTPMLIRGLDGDADLNHDGYITGSELGDYLPQAMAAYTTSQNPQYGKIRDPRLDEGDIVFRNLNPNLTPFPKASPDPGPAPSLSPAPGPSPSPALGVKPTPRLSSPVLSPSPTPQAQPENPAPRPPSALDAPSQPSRLFSVSAESVVDQSAAESLARDRLPQQAIEQRRQCRVVNVSGTLHHKCTIWYSSSSNGPEGSLP
ncbi:MAG: caspase family protein [Cyanobacteriota bacterium]|nr:caspase family protein [Cyanobacteriota bacterium]